MTLGVKVTYLATIAIMSTILISVGSFDFAFAQEYDFVAGIHTEVTFHFRDGVEKVNFPVFSTTADLVTNEGTSFMVEGVIGNNPHLHKALDEAYEHRLSRLTAGSSFEYNYRFFDVDVNVVQNESILKSLNYRHCEISEYGVKTLTDDYESYLASNSGFAMVNSIEFNCGGTHFDLDRPLYNSNPRLSQYTDYGPLPFALAEDVRTFLTFEFDNGAEKIESVIFNTMAGFSQGNYDNPSFQIITAVLPHPLIDMAIDKSQRVSGLPSSFNEDFNVYVEFENSEEVLRALHFEDCIVSGYSIVTLRDKEEGYTGKRGFATAEILNVDCSGLNPVNPKLYHTSKNNPTESSVVKPTNLYNMGTGPRIVATFDFNEGTEVVEFPEFYQGNLISRANPTFGLTGVPNNTPMLYQVVDDSRKQSSKVTGSSNLIDIFDVNLQMKYGDHVVRTYDYSKCHVIDYSIKTEHDAEESFYKGFALTNEFEFECRGYHPSDPNYDLLFTTSKAESESTLDREEREGSSWGPGFEYTKLAF